MVNVLAKNAPSGQIIVWRWYRGVANLNAEVRMTIQFFTSLVGLNGTFEPE